MRAHYADYFTKPDAMAVLGVLFLETTRQAVAVLWTRQSAGSAIIVVSEAVDFGVTLITENPVVETQFNDPALPGLPAVPTGMWVRFVRGCTCYHGTQ